MPSASLVVAVAIGFGLLVDGIRFSPRVYTARTRGTCDTITSFVDNGIQGLKDVEIETKVKVKDVLVKILEKKPPQMSLTKNATGADGDGTVRDLIISMNVMSKEGLTAFLAQDDLLDHFKTKIGGLNDFTDDECQELDQLKKSLEKMAGSNEEGGQDVVEMAKESFKKVTTWLNEDEHEEIVVAPNGFPAAEKWATTLDELAVNVAKIAGDKAAMAKFKEHRDSFVNFAHTTSEQLTKALNTKNPETFGAALEKALAEALELDMGIQKNPVQPVTDALKGVHALWTKLATKTMGNEKWGKALDNLAALAKFLESHSATAMLNGFVYVAPVVESMLQIFASCGSGGFEEMREHAEAFIAEMPKQEEGWKQKLGQGVMKLIPKKFVKRAECRLSKKLTTQAK